MTQNPEVLIYIDRVKQFLKTNVEARDYFLKDGDEVAFFNHLSIISEKNFETNGTPELSQEQMELLRRTVIVEQIAAKKYIYSEDGLFLYYENYPPVCMN